MKKIIRLTESELARIIERVVKENKKSSSDETKFVSCSQLGVKHVGKCERKTKKPVESCGKLGVKTPGYCYVDTKKPVSSK
jgi:hypothetical protein